MDPLPAVYSANINYIYKSVFTYRAYTFLSIKRVAFNTVVKLLLLFKCVHLSLLLCET